MAQRGENEDRERRPLSFPNWKQALSGSSLAPADEQAQAHAIIAFLGFCKRRHAPASIILIKEYLAHLPEQEANTARLGLRWFVRSAERLRAGGGTAAPPIGLPCAASAAHPDCEAWPGAHPRSQAAAPPPLAVNDQGGPEWERDLIKACRERHFLWRTEETYRMWGARFARFLAPRLPYAAEAADVAAFLSRMAVEERASVSAQKQALNALVFLMQEALHRELGEIDFHRSQKPRRLPTVLSNGECLPLFPVFTIRVHLRESVVPCSGRVTADERGWTQIGLRRLTRGSPSVDRSEQSIQPRMARIARVRR